MRYKAIDEAEHSCCYGASVVDTHDDDITVCECFNMETAERIAHAMNEVYK
jgi:hypothetical protein